MNDVELMNILTSDTPNKEIRRYSTRKDRTSLKDKMLIIIQKFKEISPEFDDGHDWETTLENGDLETVLREIFIKFIRS